MESYLVANVMLAVGTMADAGGRLHYSEVYSYAAGEQEDMARLNLQAFLPLRERVRERFPAAAELSDQQLLLLLTYTTLPWPIDRQDSGIYGNDTFYGSVLHMVASQYEHSECTRGHPAWRPAPSQPYQTMDGRYVVRGVPSDMTLDNTCRLPRYSKCVDRLPVSLTFTPEFRADLNAKLALVTAFHFGQRR